MTKILRKDFIGPLMPKGYNPMVEVEVKVETKPAKPAKPAKPRAKRQGVGDLKLVKDIIDDTKVKELDDTIEHAKELDDIIEHAKELDDIIEHAKELDDTIEHAKEQSDLVAKILSLKEELRDLEAKLDKPITQGYKKPVNHGIGDYIRTQILEGLGNKEILTKVHDMTGNTNTTYACVAWYRNDLRTRDLI